jgi:phosphate transport system substrate-binding protein
VAGHVFLSYSHQRLPEYAHRLAAVLRENGVAVWYDDKLVTGDRWELTIRSQIDTCAAVIVLMTPAAEESEWVSRELARAVARGKPIIPLLLEGEPFFSLGNRQYEDVRGGRLPSPAFAAWLRGFVAQAVATPPINPVPASLGPSVLRPTTPGVPPPPMTAPPVAMPARAPLPGRPPTMIAPAAQVGQPLRRSRRWLPIVLGGIATVLVVAVILVIVQPWKSTTGNPGSHGPTSPIASPSGPGPASASPTPSTACATGSLSGQGSTLQTSAISSWISRYEAICADATINYASVGSGAGIQAFINGTVDFAGTDVPMNPDQQETAKAHCGGGSPIHLPMLATPIAVVTNVAGVADLSLSANTLAAIYSGQITRWDDAAVKAENPGVNLPSTAITPVHRTDSSSANTFFTSYLAAAAPSRWTFGANKTWPQSLGGGQGGAGSDAVAAMVANTSGAVGYVEWSFALTRSLNIARIRTDSGAAVVLADDAVGRMIAAAQIVGIGADLQLSLDYRTTAAGAYPIVSVTYEVVCFSGNPGGNVALLKSFLGYAAGAGQDQLNGFGYAKLPASLRSRVSQAVASLS